MSNIHKKIKTAGNNKIKNTNIQNQPPRQKIINKSDKAKNNSLINNNNIPNKPQKRNIH